MILVQDTVNKVLLTKLIDKGQKVVRQWTERVKGRHQISTI